MNIILVGRRHGQSRSFHITGARLVLAAVAVAVIFGVCAYGGYWVAAERVAHYQAMSPTVVASWQARLDSQRERLQALKIDANQQIDALTLRLGEMQARLLRLDALGQRLVDVAKLDNGEFDFESPAAVGGPHVDAGGESFTAPDLESMLARMDARMTDRENQLELLGRLLENRHIEAERFLAGRPIRWGWLSSHYGYRTDPFSGKRTWHDGVDLAGKDGSDVIAVAAGVVTWASERYGYGNLVEVDHGDGHITRYGHAKEIKVAVGDVVQKGQVLALMGSTGRSTGPHVHFEVLKNGRSQDPVKYIQRASR
ncbi:M23 family metallopeptidase [Hydrocarboniclastica marina]|uniref:M23ase beta-sheet core domain-containing protein n=1 Tax=Hydrocarboniclastica marina TaxID=2259620 RepID=A0A4P7XE77_9ALTE|nr:M23 family metallopeptidase [Hydrocarboniclastica marina]MAL99894.1 hypothetical protein [Alteromonadaceae bacterium]QCF25146.1 hypothetical protein soil367_03935 [Hydrocarboniclastica marina]